MHVRVHAGRPFLKKALVQIMQCFHTADACPDNRADTVTVFFIQIHARIVQRQFRGRNGILCGRIHVARFFTVDTEFRNIELLDFAGNTSGIFRRIKMRNRADTVPARQQR